MKNTVIRTRIDIELKESVEKILSSLGMTSSDAIRIFFKQIELRKGLPFAVELPIKEAEKVVKDAENEKDLISHTDLIVYKDPDDIYKMFGI